MSRRTTNFSNSSNSIDHCLDDHNLSSESKLIVSRIINEIKSLNGKFLEALERIEAKFNERINAKKLGISQLKDKISVLTG